MDINKFFNFEYAWNEIVLGYKTDGKFNMESLDTIGGHSIREHVVEPYFKINKQECEVSHDQIVFVFDEGLEPSEDSAWITIIYDTEKEEFTSYRYC